MIHRVPSAHRAALWRFGPYGERWYYRRGGDEAVAPRLQRGQGVPAPVPPPIPLMPDEAVAPRLQRGQGVPAPVPPPIPLMPDEAVALRFQKGQGVPAPVPPPRPRVPDEAVALRFQKGQGVPAPVPPPRPIRPDHRRAYLLETDAARAAFEREAAALEARAQRLVSEGAIFDRDAADVRRTNALTRTTLQRVRDGALGPGQITTAANLDQAIQYYKTAAGLDPSSSAGLNLARQQLDTYESKLCVPLRQRFCESHSGTNCPAPCERPSAVRKLWGSTAQCVYPASRSISAPWYRGPLVACPADAY